MLHQNIVLSDNGPPFAQAENTFRTALQSTNCFYNL